MTKSTNRHETSRYKNERTKERVSRRKLLMIEQKMQAAMA